MMGSAESNGNEHGRTHAGSLPIPARAARDHSAGLGTGSLSARVSTVNYIGAGLQVLGAAVTAYGLVRTYQASGRTESFLAYLIGPVVETVQAIYDALAPVVRRIFRRPESRVVRPVGASLQISWGRPAVRIGYGPLKDDVGAALAELHRRTQELVDKVQTVDEQLADEIDRRKEVEDALRRDLNEQGVRLSSQGQRVTTSGMRAQAVGLLLLAVGVVLAVWPL